MASDIEARSLFRPLVGIFQCLANRQHGFINRHMLPKPHNSPSSFLQEQGVRTITLAIPGQLRAPVVGIRSWLASMFRARMPETTVDEDRDPTPGEHDVWPDASAYKIKAKVDPVPVPGTMQFRAQP